MRAWIFELRVRDGTLWDARVIDRLGSKGLEWGYEGLKGGVCVHGAGVRGCVRVFFWRFGFGEFQRLGFSMLVLGFLVKSWLTAIPVVGPLDCFGILFLP